MVCGDGRKGRLVSIQINVKFEPAALVALAPEPPKPIDVPPAARAGAEVRVPHVGPGV